MRSAVQTNRAMCLTFAIFNLTGIGCGDDKPEPMDTAGSGGSVAVGSGGSVAAGSGGAGGAGAAKQPVTCGTKTCTTPFDGMFDDLPDRYKQALPTACCADAATSTCGTSVGGGACLTPLPKEQRCPDVMLSGISLTSCCTSEEMCGVDGSSLGMAGCIDIATMFLGAQMGPQAMQLQGQMVPAPRRCDSMPLSTDGTDAGSD